MDDNGILDDRKKIFSIHMQKEKSEDSVLSSNTNHPFKKSGGNSVHFFPCNVVHPAFDLFFLKRR